MLAGSCLCGSVAYEVDGAPGPIVHCHCRTCRKAHGSVFSTVTNVPRDRFRWTRGENLLKGFESSPGKIRYFCSQCGSQIVAERAGTGTILLRMGCLDTEITERPKSCTSGDPMARHGSIRKINCRSGKKALRPNPETTDG